MFRARQRDESEEAGFGQPHASPSPRVAAGEALRREEAVVLPFPATGIPARHPARSARPATRRSLFEAWCARLDLAPDLAEDIGSRRWLRGMATLIGLGALSLAFTPSLSAVEAATGTPIDAAARKEFRSQGIAPLALGSGTGRRMDATPRMRALESVPERPTIQMVSTLGQGDSLPRMLERAGVGGADVDRVAALVAQAVPLSQLTPGTRFDVTLGPRVQAGGLRSLDSLDFRARFDLDLGIERRDGTLALVRHAIPVDATPLRVRGTVGSSLYRSARNAGAPIGAIQSYLQAIDKYVSLESDVTATDEFDFVLSYRRSAKGERQVGDLLYAGLIRDGKPRLQLLRWGKDGAMYAASSFDSPAQGAAMPIGQPVAGRITSTYGMRRHPILGYLRMHAGIDFGAPYGSPIYAVADGMVSFAGRHGGHGNYVRLEHGGGLGTGYGHMSRIAVAYGSRVRAGQVIGYVGSTGLSTGPHLHFEAYRAGRTIDPSGIRLAASPQIPVDGRERNAFAARIKALLGIQPGAALAPVAAAPRSSEAGRKIDREIDRLAAAG